MLTSSACRPAFRSFRRTDANCHSRGRCRDRLGHGSRPAQRVLSMTPNPSPKPFDASYADSIGPARNIRSPAALTAEITRVMAARIQPSCRGRGLLVTFLCRAARAVALEQIRYCRNCRRECTSIWRGFRPIFSPHLVGRQRGLGLKLRAPDSAAANLPVFDLAHALARRRPARALTPDSRSRRLVRASPALALAVIAGPPHAAFSSPLAASFSPISRSPSPTPHEDVRPPSRDRRSRSVFRQEALAG